MVHSLTVVLAAVAVLMAGAKTHGHMKAFRHGLEVQVRASQTNDAVKNALIEAYEEKENIPDAMVPICPETLNGFATSLGAIGKDVLQVKNFKPKQENTACRGASFAAMALTVLDTETFEAFAEAAPGNNFPTEDELASIGECNFAILNGKFSADANSDQKSSKVIQCEKATFDSELGTSLETHLNITLSRKQKDKLTLCKNMQNYNGKKYDIGLAKTKKICASPDMASSAGGFGTVVDAMKKKLQEREQTKATCTPKSLIVTGTKPVLDYNILKTGVPAIFKSVTPDGYTHIYVRAKAEGCVGGTRGDTRKGDIDMAIFLVKKDLPAPELVWTYNHDSIANKNFAGVKVTVEKSTVEKEIGFGVMSHFKIGDIQVIACNDDCVEEPKEVLADIAKNIPELKAYLAAEAPMDKWRGDEWMYFSSVTSADASFRLRLMLTPYNQPCEKFTVDYSWHQYDNCLPA